MTNNMQLARVDQLKGLLNGELREIGRAHV